MNDGIEIRLDLIANLSEGCRSCSIALSSVSFLARIVEIGLISPDSASQGLRKIYGEGNCAGLGLVIQQDQLFEVCGLQEEQEDATGLGD
jgi:hypothetical protein